MRRPLNTVWKIPKHLTSHTRAYAYFLNVLFNLDNACFHTTVTESTWDEGSKRWIVCTDKGDAMREQSDQF